MPGYIELLEESKEAKLESFWDAKAVLNSVNYKKRTIDIVMTTKQVDLDGDIVDPAGLDFSQYNGTVLWAHQFSTPSVMKMVEGSIKVYADRVEGTVQFDGKTQSGKDLFNLATAGYIKSWSLTFLASEYDPIEKELEDGSTYTTGLNVTKAIVIEVTLCNVGKNPGARSKAFEIVKDPELKKEFAPEEPTVVSIHIARDGMTVDTETLDIDKLNPTVFKKSFEERGDKIPTDIIFTKDLKDVGYKIDFEPVLIQDKILKEGKVKAITLIFPLVDPESPSNDDGREDDDAEPLKEKHFAEELELLRASFVSLNLEMQELGE